jgi:ADP-heptose:LPS heptosyltransferase
VAAGALSLAAAIRAMGACAFHLGNDTGTMHMAASAGIRCVGVYASRNLPGLWFPYGSGHRVLRTPIDCENCQLFECIDRKMACILAITPSRVIEACEEILETAAGAR